MEIKDIGDIHDIIQESIIILYLLLNTEISDLQKRIQNLRNINTYELLNKINTEYETGNVRNKEDIVNFISKMIGEGTNNDRRI